jgi:hypothetical protein
MASFFRCYRNCVKSSEKEGALLWKEIFREEGSRADETMIIASQGAQKNNLIK